MLQFKAHKGPYKLAFVNGFAGNAWRIQCIQAAKAWAARPENAKDIKEFKVVSTGTDIAAQIAACDNFIAAGFDGIIFIAVNPTAFDPVIKRAKRAGTVLVPFDNVLDTDKIVQVNEPQKQFEQIKAKGVVKHMGTKGRILEVRGVPGNATDRDRHVGLHEYLEQFPDIEVVTVVGNWDTGTVQKVVADAIATHGRFDGIVVQHGTAGAINAILDAGHPIVPISGDAENGVRLLMAKHNIKGASVEQSPSMSAVALMATVALLKGEALPQLIYLPIPHAFSENFKAGVDYFPDLPPTFNTATSFNECGLVFTPEELMAQTADNM
jgi:ribose transport system substrate-binding protein